MSEPITDPEVVTLSEEELAMQEIMDQPDLEEFIIRDNIRVGRPIKCWVIQSAILNKKVVSVPCYHRLRHNGSTKGYKQWGIVNLIRPFAEPLDFEFVVLADVEE